MVFVLPDAGISPEELVCSPESTAALFDSSGQKFALVEFRFPKYDFTNNLNLVAALQNLGIELAFGPNADFSGISKDGLLINDVCQNARVTVDEKGVTAEAVTQMEFETAAEFPVPDNIYMNLNRPFLFGILTPDGTLLFAGICRNLAS